MNQYQNIIGPVSIYIRTSSKIYNIPNTNTKYTDQKYKIYGPKVQDIWTKSTIYTDLVTRHPVSPVRTFTSMPKKGSSHA